MILLLAPVILSFLILLMPSGLKFLYTLVFTLVVIGITSFPAITCFMNPGDPPQQFFIGGPLGTITFTLDSLSAFFMLVTHFTVLTGLLYSNGYLKPYRVLKTPADFGLHYFSYCWLHLSMIAVLTLREGFAFLIAWELMAVSSCMLILFEAEKRQTLKTAVNYLVQMHVGLVLLIIAFLVTESGSGSFGFDGLAAYFAAHPNAPLFFLFFAGFAVKAGFIPFHTWLPEAHPAAPSHVSGVMSGVMIKMGIYGIVRVILSVQNDLILIGGIILLISALSGLLGVLMAIVQHDLKKLLAYHSIENIGIIGMGIGLGALGLGLHHPVLAVLGFTGGLLHVLNHSLFKSLLFFSAGSVYQSSHTRNIEELGGVIHRMPGTALLFLTGAVAICGLPPLNGFISEFLIYLGLFTGLPAGSAYQSIAFILAIVTLTLIGGLAIFCFTKAFGVVFLGSPRREYEKPGAEAGNGMLFPQIMIGALIILIGFLPMAFINPLAKTISTQTHIAPLALLTSLGEIFTSVSVVSVTLIVMIVALILCRQRMMRTRPVEYGPTWGCGYTAGTARQQYTGTSYARNLSEIAQPILRSKTEFLDIHEEDLFPGKRSFALHPQDIFNTLINSVVRYSMMALKKIARLQTGNIQHYILYAFIYILIILALLYMNIL